MPELEPVPEIELVTDEYNASSRQTISKKQVDSIWRRWLGNARTRIEELALPGIVFSQTADKTIANTTTETTLFGTGVGSLTLPANFWEVGKIIRMEIHGDMSDTGNPTAEVRVKFGSTTLTDSTAITLKGLSGTEQWECIVIITCRTVGTTGTLEAVVDFEYETTTGSSAIERLDVAGTLTTVNTTVSSAMDITFQWGTANASNTITSDVAFIDVLNQEKIMSKISQDYAGGISHQQNN